MRGKPNLRSGDRPRLLRWVADVNKLSAIIRERGVVRATGFGALTLLHRVHDQFDWRFDQNHGVSTCGFIGLDEVDIDSKNKIHGEPYGPSHMLPTKRSIGQLPIDYRDFVFIDFGSGKGKALLIASTFSFKRVIGIEYCKEIHDIAVKNIQIFPPNIVKTKRTISTHEDAANFEIPNENCVFYFYNPFSSEILSQVISRISKSYAENPRKMYIIYYDTSAVRNRLSVLESAPFLRRLANKRIRFFPYLLPSPHKTAFFETL